MQYADWSVVTVYFVLMVAIGLWARRRVGNAADYFTAGGRLPWWRPTVRR